MVMGLYKERMPVIAMGFKPIAMNKLVFHAERKLVVFTAS
jgi:hypothetical protein